MLKLLDETQSHRKEPHVISSKPVITSCEKGRKLFLSSVLWIDAKFVGVMEPLRVWLLTAVVHPLYCGILTELNLWKSITSEPSVAGMIVPES